MFGVVFLLTAEWVAEYNYFSVQSLGWVTLFHFLAELLSNFVILIYNIY